MATTIGRGDTQRKGSSGVLLLTLAVPVVASCRYSYQKYYGQLHNDPICGPNAQFHHEGKEHCARH